MNDAKIIGAFENHAKAINKLNAEFKAMQKVVDKTYVENLTHVMMWDVLMSLLESKGIMTQKQFNEALKELSDKTKAEMLEEQKRKAEQESKTKTTVLSQEPAIPVIK